jgi:formylglycine-generating enzyme required for sulfatase activity
MNASSATPHIREWLERQPIVPMLLTGLAIGFGTGAWALWGLGGWWGGLVCLLLVGLATALSWGAKPVLEVAVEPSDEPAMQEEFPKKSELSKKPYALALEEISDLFNMVELKGGTFWMGSDEDDAEKPRHQVTVSDFAIMQTPVTRGLFREVMNKEAIPWEWVKKGDDDLLPATDVDWFTAVDFCNVLSERRGMGQCYKSDGETVTWNPDHDGYRLATEAEWEYACRALTETRWFCGDDEKKLADYAWFDKGLEEGPFPVAQKKPNPWQLYDMAGNVYEWCWDWYGPYDEDSQENPTGPKMVEGRSLRGGSFSDSALFLRSACRVWFEPVLWSRSFGFRCVRAPRRQA